MTIGHIASSFLQSTANLDGASHDSQSFTASCSAPPLTPAVQTVVGHYAMLWYAPTCLGMSSVSFEPPRNFDTGYSSSLGALLEVARARTVVVELVEAVNVKARFYVYERSDVIIMRAENHAARNMLRAYSGLIRARTAEIFDVTTPVEVVELGL